MKKSIFLILSIFVLTISNADAKIDLGIMTGFQVTDASYVPNEQVTKTLFAFPLFGLYSKFSLNDKFAIQFSPSFTTKKIGANQNYKIEMEANYIDLPILISYEFDLGMVKPYIFVGPNLGIILNPKSISYFSTSKIEEDINKEVEDIEYSIKIGAGLEIEFESFSIFGQAFYGFGLNDIYNEPSYVDFPKEVYLRNIGANVGISYHIGNL